MNGTYSRMHCQYNAFVEVRKLLSRSMIVHPSRSRTGHDNSAVKNAASSFEVGKPCSWERDRWPAPTIELQKRGDHRLIATWRQIMDGLGGQ